VILFLEGQASQREVILGARQALPSSIKVYASHHQDRPEITGQADIAWREPAKPQERVDWALEMAVKHGIKVVHAGRKADIYEARRDEFAAESIELVTGARSIETFRIENKKVFTDDCAKAGLRCVPAILVNNGEELTRAYASLAARGEEVCVKPVAGIYGQGFWRLEDHLDAFRCLSSPDDRRIKAMTFISLYHVSKEQEPLLVMPYLPGDEVSVDVVCEGGRPIAWVGRRKRGLYQTFERTGEAIDLALAAVSHFGCDGIVNVQTMDDARGVPHLLEINLRYSGGLSYTGLSGINLPGIFATRRLCLQEPASVWRDGVRIKPTSAAIPVH
jgi:hypothetical protein